MTILIYLIYHNDSSYQAIKEYENYPYIKLVRIETTKYFESIIFKYLAENKNDWISKKYVGLLTYSFKRKLRISLDRLFNILNTDKYDLVSLHHVKGPYSILGGSFHGDLKKKIFDHVLPMFGYETPINYNIPTFFCNYWITRPIWMEKYIDFALAFIDKLNDENDTYLQSMLNSSSQYIGKLTPSQLTKLFGVPYYPNHPFIMERLPCIFFWKNNFTKTSRKSARFAGWRSGQPPTPASTGASAGSLSRAS